MLHLYGVPVTPEDAAWIDARLYADAHTDAVAAAHIIETGVDRELYVVALTPAHRDAILRHLEACPEGLAELRGRLLRDNRVRITQFLGHAGTEGERVTLASSSSLN